MASCDRRSFLASVGAGAVFGGALPRIATPRGEAPIARPGLDEIAAALTRVEPEQAFAKTAELAGAGATWRDVLGGTFLAGVREIVPRPVGFKFHAVMMTASAYEIAAAVPEADRWWAAYYNVEDFKRSQADDRARGDWKLAEPDVGARALDDAPARLAAALDAWDEKAADTAAIALHASASLDDAFEILWRYAARDFGAIGHKAIWTAQAHRTLLEIGWCHGEPVLRSLVFGMLDGKPGENDASHAENRARAVGLPDAWQDGSRDDDAASRLRDGLREATGEGAARLVEDLLAAGVAVGSVWDGLRLFAFEQLWLRPGIVAVHPVTTVNALRYAFERARDDATRRVLLLQAASWSIGFRDFLAGRPAFAGRSGLDRLEPGGDKDLDAGAVFALAARDRDAAIAAAHAAVEADGLPAFASRAREALLVQVREHHDYKFAAAAFAEIADAAEHWRPLLAAASLAYLRAPAEADGPFATRARPFVTGTR